MSMIRWRPRQGQAFWPRQDPSKHVFFCAPLSGSTRKRETMLAWPAPSTSTKTVYHSNPQNAPPSPERKQWWASWAKATDYSQCFFYVSTLLYGNKVRKTWDKTVLWRRHRQRIKRPRIEKQHKYITLPHKQVLLFSTYYTRHLPHDIKYVEGNNKNKNHITLGQLKFRVDMYAEKPGSFKPAHVTKKAVTLRYVTFPYKKQ